MGRRARDDAHDRSLHGQSARERMPAHRRSSSVWRRAASVLVAAGLVTALAACTNDPLAQAYRDSDTKGWVANDFRVVPIPEDERSEPIEFSGESEAGEHLTSTDFADKVLVVNFWYASCGPCRAEAKYLEEVHQKYEAEGAAFLGINIYDQAETAAAFAKTFSVTYPSLLAIDDGPLKLAFAGTVPLSAPPVTLVLDRQGRVAARIIGQLEDASILSTLVRETLAETS